MVSPEDLAIVPYLDVSVIGGRIVNLMPLWDGAEWHHWFPSPEGLLLLKVGDWVHGDYIAVEPAREDDLLIPFVEFMWQRASWPSVCPYIRAISDDFHNIATSLAKIKHFYFAESLSGIVATSFVETEIEYFMMLLRSIFDLLQEAISKIWKDHVRLLDDQAEQKRKRRQLPDTFSKMVLREKRDLRTAQEIADDQFVPLQVAEKYAATGPFFLSVRDIRDKIVHSGTAVSMIFITDKGFCIDPRATMYAGISEWPEDHRFNENLVSLMPWLAYVVFHTIEACSDIMAAFASVIQFPPPIAPGYHVLVRGSNNETMIELLRVAQGASPWWIKTTA